MGKADFKEFQSTLPLRGATCGTGQPQSYRRISIHAPLTGSDLYKLSLFRGLQHFNPRSPYGERPLRIYSRGGTRIFQSTLPLRGATSMSISESTVNDISIHAPLTGSDDTVLIMLYSGWNFNPRSPYGERRGKHMKIISPYHISIHAPLTGSDQRSQRRDRVQRVFQSTLPLRGATPNRPPPCAVRRFQSTLPLRGATFGMRFGEVV